MGWSSLSPVVVSWLEWIEGIGVWVFGIAFTLALVGFALNLLARGKSPDGATVVTGSVFSGRPVSKPKSFKG